MNCIGTARLADAGVIPARQKPARGRCPRLRLIAINTITYGDYDAKNCCSEAGTSAG